MKRKTFGVSLIEHAVIRNKLGHMIRQCEATHAWLVTPSLLGGPIALLKAQSTQTFEYCAREAAQIFGGLAYTRGGQGEKVERLYREVRGNILIFFLNVIFILIYFFNLAYAIPGGSEG
jgi:alkylation response protein AidB-like acyl-CoA dehydrogenase